MDIGSEFKYLSSMLTEENEMVTEVDARIASASICAFVLGKQLFRGTKI